MAFKIVITTGPLEWSNRKRDVMIEDWKMLLSREGAPNCQMQIVEETPKEEIKPRILYLHSKCCNQYWKGEFISPCPACQGRSGVEKIKEDAFIEGLDWSTKPVASEPVKENGKDTSSIFIADPDRIMKIAVDSDPPVLPLWWCGKCQKPFAAPKRQKCGVCGEYRRVSSYKEEKDVA